MRHGSNLDPPNRFERIHSEADPEHLEWDDEYLKERTDRKIQYLPDSSKSIVSENDSPTSVSFQRESYRGCVHACSYCYARNSHEYLGLNAGWISRRRSLSNMMRRNCFENSCHETSGFLNRSSSAASRIAISRRAGVRLTRQCLEVANECHQPISIITKNALVLRDLELLRDMASRNLVHVNLSITTLDADLARVMEPRTSIPVARLRAVKTLVEAGVPVRVMVAPIIPV